MITYRKKSLKVRNISARYLDGYYTEGVAKELKEFIEIGDYSRIVEILIFGESNESLICSIIYEQSLEEKNE